MSELDVKHWSLLGVFPKFGTVQSSILRKGSRKSDLKWQCTEGPVRVNKIKFDSKIKVFGHNYVGQPNNKVKKTDQNCCIKCMKLL